MGIMPLRPTRASTRRTEEYVNSLPSLSPGYSGAVRMVRDDGPAPMKNYRPAKKRLTGYDQFWLQHDAEYEARGKSPPQCRVEMHNTAYPKLRDELENKLSTSKPTVTERRMNRATSQAFKATFYDPRCRKCMREKRAQEKRERTVKGKAGGRKNSERKPKSRVRKTKSPRRIRRRQTRYTRLNRGCQYFPPDSTTPKSLISSSGNSVQCDETENPVVIKNSHSNNSGEINNNNASKTASLNMSNKYPDTNHPSVTSYHSYPSMDHEPMVAP